MRYGGIIFDDFANGQGVCTSIFLQGCPIKCHGCHNQDLQDFDGGKEFTTKELTTIIQSLTANGVQRNLCILGGEPLCAENLATTFNIAHNVHEMVPNAKIFVWTGYKYEWLLSQEHMLINDILNISNYLIDGPYIENQRDITLLMRGSSNQRIIDLKETIAKGEIITIQN